VLSDKDVSSVSVLARLPVYEGIDVDVGEGEGHVFRGNLEPLK